MCLATRSKDTIVDVFVKSEESVIKIMTGSFISTGFLDSISDLEIDYS